MHRGRIPAIRSRMARSERYYELINIRKAENKGFPSSGHPSAVRALPILNPMGSNSCDVHSNCCGTGGLLKEMSGCLAYKESGMSQMTPCNGS
jgi:hypothetical protein